VARRGLIEYPVGSVGCGVESPSTGSKAPNGKCRTDPQCGARIEGRVGGYADSASLPSYKPLGKGGGSGGLHHGG